MVLSICVNLEVLSSPIALPKSGSSGFVKSEVPISAGFVFYTLHLTDNLLVHHFTPFRRHRNPFNTDDDVVPFMGGHQGLMIT